MADVPQTTSLIVLAQNYAGDIVRTINRTAATLSKIPIVVGDGGKNLAWVAESSGALAFPYLEGADIVDFGSDAQASAVLQWAQYASPWHVTGLARATARTSATPQGNVALWARNMVNGCGQIASVINAALYAGDDTASPVQVGGYDRAIGSASNVYATIDRSSSAFWRPYVANPGSATTLTLAQIRDDIKSIYVQSGEYPDMASCHPSVFNRVIGLFDANRQYMQMVTQFSTAKGQILLGGAKPAVMIDGCVFYEDKDCTLESGNTSGRIYYHNTNHEAFVVLPQDDTPGIGPDMQLTANDGFGQVPLLVSFEVLAKTGDSAKAYVKVYGQLRIKNPNRFGVRRFVAF